MKLGLVFFAALFAAAPAKGATVTLGPSSADFAALPAEEEGTDDCSAGCLFAGEPEHGPLFAGTPGLSEATRFPIRLDSAQIRLQDPGTHTLALLVLSRPSTFTYVVKARIPLGTHGPGVVNSLVSGTSRTVCVSENDWIGLHVVHAGKTTMLSRIGTPQPGKVARAVGVDPAEGATVQTDGTFGKNRLLPLRVTGVDGATDCAGGGETPPGGGGGGGAPGADLRVTETHTVDPTGDQRVGRRYRLKVVVENRGPAKASNVGSVSIPAEANKVGLVAYTSIFTSPFVRPQRGTSFKCAPTQLQPGTAFGCAVPALNAGERLTYVVDTLAQFPGAGTATTLVASDTADPVPANNADSTPVRVRIGPIPGSSVVCDDDKKIVGSIGDDRLAGGTRGDLVLALAGKDRVVGRQGDDCLFGDEGADRLEGGPNDDFLDGGAGADTVRGDDGDDLVSGGDGPDTAEGGPGADRLTGDGGRDRLRGGAGNDRIDAADGAGGDRVECGAGRDRVDADRGDTIARDCESIDTA